MYRVSAWDDTGGFDERLIAGEEPELCLRLRRKGWGIMRLDSDMAWHDIGMTRFGQWWRRMRRSGYVYAEGVAQHVASPDRQYARQAASVVTWGTIVPLLVIGFAWPTQGLSLLGFALYPVLAARTTRHARSTGLPARDAMLYGIACAVAKFPQSAGLWTYWGHRLLGKRRGLLEYRAEPHDSRRGPN